MISVPLIISAMSQRSLRSPPDLSECPDPADPAITAELRATWRKRHGPDLELAAQTGTGAAAVVVVVGTWQRAHEVFVFTRGAGAGLDGPLGAAVDVADRLLLRLLAGEELRALLPLDWEGQEDQAGVVFVRGELRSYSAEEEAAALLDEEAPPRALPGFPTPAGRGPVA